MVDNYAEAIALVALGNGSIEYRTFSICNDCKAKLNEKMVVMVLKDVIEYEREEKRTLTSTSRKDLQAFDDRYGKWQVMGWANNRMDLDDKLTIKK